MTTPEHTLVGIHLALASGRDRAWGWRAVALAGLMSNAPDWDGLTLLVDMGWFDRGHRVCAPLPPGRGPRVSRPAPS